MRLIDAEWILGEIDHDLGCYEIENIEQEDGLYVELRDVVKMVFAAPTIDAVPVVHGRWGNYEPFSDAYRCSNCKITHRTCTKYCPNCGAKMDGGGNG